MRPALLRPLPHDADRRRAGPVPRALRRRDRRAVRAAAAAASAAGSTSTAALIAFAVHRRRARRVVLPSRPAGARVALGGAVAHVVAVARGDRAAGVHGRRRCSTPSRTSCGWKRRSPRCRRASPSTRRSSLGVAGTLLAFALFVCTGDDLRLPAVPARMGDAAHGRQLHRCWAARRGSRSRPRSRRRPRRRSSRFFAGWALVLTLLGFAGRVASLVRNARLRPKSTLQTAIGIKHPRIVQKSQGFMGGSFNTREFFHGRSAAFAALDQVVVSAGARSRCPRCCSRRRWPARRRRRSSSRSSCSTSGSSPSAGTSSRRPTTRRISTTRRSPEACDARRPFAARSAIGYNVMSISE